MIVKVIFVVLLLVLNPWAAIGQTKGESGVRGEIVGQGGLKFPIAVSPLKNLGATTDVAKQLSEGIADTIVYDLDLSGWFKVLDRAAYIENPQKSGVALGTFDFKDWSTIGAEGLVKGGFTIQGDRKSTRLNSSHLGISYAVFCLKKKRKKQNTFKLKKKKVRNKIIKNIKHITSTPKVA